MQTIESINLICSCGKEYTRKDRFHIYDHNFCSMKCLSIYKIAFEEKQEKTQKKYNASHNAADRYYEGGSAY